MKSLTTIAILVTCTNAAAILQPRQLGGLAGGLASALMPKQKALKIEEIPPTTQRPGAKRVRMRYGPYVLRGAGSKEKTTNGKSMDPAGSAWNYLADTDFPRDITMLVSDARIMFEDGSPAEVPQGVYNHHVVAFNFDKTSPGIVGCEKGSTRMAQIPMSIIAGRSEDKATTYLTTPDGKFNSGYYIGKNDKIMLMGDLVNYKNNSQTVFEEMEIEYVLGKVPDSLEVSQAVISVGQCDGSAGAAVGFNAGPPAGQKKWAIKSKEMTMLTDGYFVSAKGHLHDGGVNLILTLNGKEVCNSQAKYGGANATTAVNGQKWDTINEMTSCPVPLEVKKGDKLKVDAYYDLEEHPARVQHGGTMAEEMALIGASFAIKPTK